MLGRKMFQATQMASQTILGMADEKKGRECDWSAVSEGKGCQQDHQDKVIQDFLAV